MALAPHILLSDLQPREVLADTPQAVLDAAHVEFTNQ